MVLRGAFLGGSHIGQPGVTSEETSAVRQTNENDTQLMKLDEYQPCDRRDSSDGSHFDRPDTR